jgi:hypothetical protein
MRRRATCTITRAIDSNQSSKIGSGSVVILVVSCCDRWRMLLLPRALLVLEKCVMMIHID